MDPRVEVAVADRAFTLTRWLDAPRDRVWRAWTDPRELAQWWGPHGFTNPVAEADVRPGGSLRIVMRSPEGEEFPMSGEFLEVDPPARLVFTDDITDEMPAEWRARIDSYRPSRRRGRVRIAVTSRSRSGMAGRYSWIRNTFASDEDRDAVMRDGAASGWSESMERLEALVTAA